MAQSILMVFAGPVSLMNATGSKTFADIDRFGSGVEKARKAPQSIRSRLGIAAITDPQSLVRGKIPCNMPNGGDGGQYPIRFSVFIVQAPVICWDQLATGVLRSCCSQK